MTPLGYCGFVGLRTQGTLAARSTLGFVVSPLWGFYFDTHVSQRASLCLGNQLRGHSSLMKSSLKMIECEADPTSRLGWSAD